MSNLKVHCDSVNTGNIFLTHVSIFLFSLNVVNISAQENTELIQIF